MVQRKQRVGSIQLLLVGKGGLPSFLYPIFYKIDRYCFHLKTQLKYLPYLPPAKREEDKDEQNLHKHSSSNRSV